MDTMSTIVFCSLLFIVGSVIFYLICEGIIYLICKLPDWIVGTAFLAILFSYIFKFFSNKGDKE
jgi:hypothetical protein